jgi:hypothetical protein
VGTAGAEPPDPKESKGVGAGLRVVERARGRAV